MTLAFVDKFQDALVGGNVLILLCHEHEAKAGWLNKVGGSLVEPFAKVLKEPKAGSKGCTFEAYVPASAFDRVVVALLPDKVSHWNSPTKKSFVFQLIAEGVKDAEKVSVIACLSDSKHMAPYAAAVARATQRISRKRKSKDKVVVAAFTNPVGKSLKIHDDVPVAADAIQWVCELVDTPPSELHPAEFAERAKKRLKTKGVSVHEYVGQKLLDNKMGGIYGVGKGASIEPRMVIFDYHPKGSTKTVAMIGKGLTFDTGGLSLKISGAMNTMKSDMAGAAAVLGAFEMLVKTGYKHRLIACVGLAENAIGPNSLKPDDIITQHSGKTVELNNTDAEGRLVLADCLSYVCRKYEPEVALDAATLTGAQGMATGNLHAAIFSNDEHLEQIAVHCGMNTGDMVTPLPFAPEFYQDEFKSKIADMKNSVANRMNAQSSCAAQFIWSHIDDVKVKWCHIDLAFPSFVNERGTGFGTLLMYEMAHQAFSRRAAN